MVSHLPEGDQLSKSRKQMMAQLAVSLAGRAAELVVYGESEVTSGMNSLSSVMHLFLLFIRIFRSTI